MELNRWSDNAEKVVYLLASILDGEFNDRLYQIVNPGDSPCSPVFKKVLEVLDHDEVDQGDYDAWKPVVEVCLDQILYKNYGVCPTCDLLEDRCLDQRDRFTH